MARLKITLNQLVEKFQDANRAMDDPSKLLNAVGFNLRESTVRRFSDTVSPESAPWKAPSPLTRAARPGRKGGENALEDSGELKRSIGYTVVGNEVHIGSPLKYSSVHQEGKTIYPKRGRALAVPLNDEARREGVERLRRRGLFRPRGAKILAIPLDGGTFKPMFALLAKVTIPQRKFLGISAKDEDLIQECVLDYVGGII